MFLFGMKTEEVQKLRPQYDPRQVYLRDPELRRAIDFLYHGFGGRSYAEVADSLLHRDPYMVLADYDDYARAQRESGAAYLQRESWARMALMNTAMSGGFSADRAIEDYAGHIWHAAPLSAAK